MADLGINDLTIGYSFTGALEYIEQLNAKAITETKQKLADIDGVRVALEKGWIGQAEINFMANLQKSITLTQSMLDTLKRTLDGQFAEIQESMVSQDRDMIQLN